MIALIVAIAAVGLFRGRWRRRRAHRPRLLAILPDLRTTSSGPLLGRRLTEATRTLQYAELSLENALLRDLLDVRRHRSAEQLARRVEALDVQRRRLEATRARDGEGGCA